MKRTFILTIILALASACMAVNPKLETAKIFERNDIKGNGHELVKVTQTGNHFRSLTFTNDKRMEKIVRAAVEKDRQRAYNIVERSDGKSQDYIILNIKGNNNSQVNVGLYWDDKGYMRVFMQSDKPEAFK